MQDGLYAKFNTSKGSILVNLEFEKTPGTVGNFVALAEGNLENSAKPQGTPYYDGLKFHRVIPDFMIQGGCPQGTGTGNPGYKFESDLSSVKGRSITKIDFQIEENDITTLQNTRIASIQLKAKKQDVLFTKYVSGDEEE